jgi:hypothetical protein
MWLTILLLAVSWVFGCAAGMGQRPVYQLRIYKLHAGNEQHFHERFSQQCMPIMARYGFDIVFTSESGESGHKEFVYLLRWKDRDTQNAAWKKFLADPDWVEIKKVTAARWGDLVDEVQDRSLDLLPYTPKPSEVP